MDTAPHPFVTVIIPVFNDPRIFGCLAAISKQTYPTDAFQVIVVDNNSKPPLALDPCPPNVTVISEERPGSYRARNTALQHVKGEAVVFLDADCLPNPQWLEAGVKAVMALGEPGLVGGDVQLVPTVEGHPNLFERYDRDTGGMRIQPMIEREKNMATANLFATRTAVDALGPFDDRGYSFGDRAWTRKAVDLGFPLVYSAEAWVTHPARATWKELVTVRRRWVGGYYTHRSKPQFLWYLLKCLVPARPLARILFWSGMRLHWRPVMATMHCLISWRQFIEGLAVMWGRTPERR